VFEDTLEIKVTSYGQIQQDIGSSFKPHEKCSCDLYTQILPHGCKCNGT
jgi:hypothetical protein